MSWMKVSQRAGFQRCRRHRVFGDDPVGETGHHFGHAVHQIERVSRFNTNKPRLGLQLRQEWLHT